MMMTIMMMNAELLEDADTYRSTGTRERELRMDDALMESRARWFVYAS